MFRPFALIVVVAAASALVAAAPDEAPLISTTVYARQTPQTPQTEISVILSNPGSHPKIGIQEFSVSSPSLRQAADTVASVLADDLRFEREFYVIDMKASAGIPKAATGATLPFTQWTQLGAELVLMASLRETGGKLDVEVKLIDVRPATAGKEGFSRTYGGCTAATPRFCAHSIADDMHKQLRNLTGVARTRIAFSSDRDGEPMEGRPVEDKGRGKAIFLMDYDGAQPRQYTFNRSINIGAAWGPDGRSLTWASFASGYPDIYLSMLDGRPATRPAHGTDVFQNQNPAVSPDGTKIAFTSNRSGSGYFDIWVVDRDGSNLQNLTPGTPKSSEGAATWSPTGAQIAFTSDRVGPPQIYMMNADGTGVTRVPCGPKCDRPAWSALGYIAYTLERPGGKDIAITDLSKMEPRIITDGNGANEQPTVSSNGRHIAFVTSRWGNRQIASIDYDGQNIRQLTNTGVNTYPNWSPASGGR